MRNLYFTGAGHCNISYYYTSFDRIHLGTITEGKMFGEVEAIFQRNHVVQIESKSYITLGIIEEEDAQTILQKNHEVKD